MAILFIAAFGIYFLLLAALLFGLRKTADTRINQSSKNIFISVVIAMRNEKDNVQNLLSSLSVQNYPVADFEIIIVDDHSGDGSQTEAGQWHDRLPSLQIVSLGADKNGKKAALAYGISLAKGEVITTTDADCVLPFDWLQKISQGFQSQKTNMLIGAVALQKENDRFFNNLQSMEFASVIGTSMGLAALGKPIMCNGANLSFRKEIFYEVGGYTGNEQIASGDDEFLLRKITDRYPNSIGILKDCIVITKAQKSISDFIGQRRRWAGKWKINSSLLARSLAVLIFCIQVCWLTLVVFSISRGTTLFFSILIVKLVSDFVFLFSVCRYLKLEFRPVVFIALQFLYPVYVLYTGIVSQKKNHQWKGRGI